MEITNRRDIFVMASTVAGYDMINYFNDYSVRRVPMPYIIYPITLKLSGAVLLGSINGIQHRSWRKLAKGAIIGYALASIFTLWTISPTYGGTLHRSFTKQLTKEYHREVFRVIVKIGLAASIKITSILYSTR